MNHCEDIYSRLSEITNNHIPRLYQAELCRFMEQSSSSFFRQFIGYYKEIKHQKLEGKFIELLDYFKTRMRTLSESEITKHYQETLLPGIREKILNFNMKKDTGKGGFVLFATKYHSILEKFIYE